MSTLDATRAELALAVLYLNKAEARDKICRAIQYGSKFLSNGQPGTAQNVDKTTSLARKVFRLFKVRNRIFIIHWLLTLNYRPKYYFCLIWCSFYNHLEEPEWVRMRLKWIPSCYFQSSFTLYKEENGPLVLQSQYDLEVELQ